MNNSPYYSNYLRTPSRTKQSVRTVAQLCKLLGSFNQFSASVGITFLFFILTR